MNADTVRSPRKFFFLHTLPFVSQHQIHRVPGMGTFVTQSVGSTLRTTGVHVYFQGEQSIQAHRGYIPVSVSITVDYQIVWNMFERRDYKGRGLDKTFGPRVMKKALAIVENMPSYDDVGYMFQIIGALDKELRDLGHESDRLERAIQCLTKLKSDILEGKSDSERTPEDVGEQLARAIAARNAFEVKHARRIANLTQLRCANRGWTEEAQGPRDLYRNIYDRVLAEIRLDLVAA